MTTQSNSVLVSKSILNNSTSKACFSFGKAPRSPKESKHNDAIYDKPSMLSNRSTFIGFGKKTDINPRVFSPSPEKYDKPSDFDKNPKKGCSFGISRQEFKAISMFYKTKNPGPGEYNNMSKQCTKSYAMRGRDGFPTIFKSTHNPGPGQYDVKQCTDKEFYVQSRRKSPLIYTFKKGKQNTEKKELIGPTTYETAFASMGRQILANHKSEQSFQFNKQVRETMHIQKSRVGPGSYQKFSQFGK